jgi:XTP/dITP diphosphohydrolase
VSDERRLLVATRSAGKMREIRRILAGVPDLDLVSLADVGISESPDEEALEPYDTFEENARSKAVYFHRRSGLPTVADDSGIVVDALDGAPGVRSKRFAPEDWREARSRDEANNLYLVHSLRGVPPEKRTARYVCVSVLVDETRSAVVTRGESEGRIVDEPRGTGGFGYDPHVLVPELGRTFAELTPAEKDARSHRGRAFRDLAAVLLKRGDSST